MTLSNNSKALARTRDRALPPRRHGIKRHRDPRAALHRLQRRGAQHDDPALELQDAGRAPRFYDASAKATAGTLAGAQPQSPVLAVRPFDAGALRPGDVRDGQLGRGQPHRRDRLAADLPRRSTRQPAPAMAGSAQLRTRCIRIMGRSYTTRRAGLSATTRSSVFGAHADQSAEIHQNTTVIQLERSNGRITKVPPTAARSTQVRSSTAPQAGRP